MAEAAFYSSIPGTATVVCRLCPHGCEVEPGSQGKCLSRRNDGGILYALNYQEVTKVSWEPIESVSLYHYHPGGRVLAVGSWGCNLRCAFCNTAELSQAHPPTRWVTSRELVDKAVAKPALGIAYTFSEPLMWYEFVLETAQAAQAEGVRNVLDTAGFIEQTALRELLPYVDAVNLDLKSIDDGFYRSICGASVHPVLETALTLKGKTHLEVKHMILPGENDYPSSLETVARWIARNLGVQTPTHLAAFFPAHRASRDKPTSVASMMEAFEIFRAELRHVYLSDVFSQEGNNTFCAECRAEIVNRIHADVDAHNLDARGRCGECGAENGIVVPSA